MKTGWIATITPKTHKELTGTYHIYKTTTKRFVIRDDEGRAIARLVRVRQNESTASWYTLDERSGEIINTMFASYSVTSAAVTAMASRERAARR